MATTDMTHPEHISRRTVAKGAAWTVPSLTLAAGAPVLAASPKPPKCGCVTIGSVGTFSAQSVTAFNLGTVTGSLAFNLNSAACNTGFFKPLYTIVGVSGTLSFSDNTSNAFALGATTGVGTIGQISAFSNTFSLLGKIPMPNDAIPPYGPKVPTRVCFNFTAIFVPVAPRFPRTECNYQLCFPITSPTSLGTVILGTGTVTWADTTPGTPVLTPL